MQILSTTILKYIVTVFIILMLSSCDNWNNPHNSKDNNSNILYSAFSEPPKHLDPAISYSSDEWVFVQSVYDAPLQYHYLKRPYTLEPNIAKSMPKIEFYDKDNNLLPNNSTKTVAYSKYIIDIKENVFYHKHPAFLAKNTNLSTAELAKINSIYDFKNTATREVIASDFIYQIKRIAHPKLHSPVLSVMKTYIKGLDKFSKQLLKDYKKDTFLALNNYHLEGVELLGRYKYAIIIKGVQPQFIYWLAMPFFTSIAPEVDKFYSQKGLNKKNISLDIYPVGTGAYYMAVNNPNKKIVLLKNTNFHSQLYPATGSIEDEKLGLLIDKGKKLPFVDKIIFSLEKEFISYWHKTMQGYNDKIGLHSDYFDQVLNIDKSGKKTLSKDIKNKKMQLLHNEGVIIYYAGFNMQDSLVGGNSESARLIRQAITIAIDMEEYVSIFLNGEANIAQIPIPKGIFGWNNSFNNKIYNKNNKRKSIKQAKELLKKAGYPNGINAISKKQLTISFDTTSIGPEAQYRLAWIKKQFDKINVNLIIKATNYSTFQDKLRRSQTQLFEFGWGADYPDAENFLFLFYSKNSKLKYGGDNYTNYDNPKFDELFLDMKNMLNSPKRQKIINKMLKIWQNDIPFAWAYTPKSSILVHNWVGNVKVNALAKNTLKYQKVDIKKRNEYRNEYNKVVWYPLVVLLLFVLVILWIFFKKRI